MIGLQSPAAIGYRPVEKIWSDETCVVIGGGSSLTPEDVEYCRGKARVIAVKEAHLLAPWADVLYAADPKWWRFWDGANSFTGLKFSIDGMIDKHEPGQFPDVQILLNTGTDGIETDPIGLRTGYNSGYQAINLAVHLGATRIVLLGFDMWRGANGQQNWFGRHPNHVPSPYPIFMQAFTTIVDPLRELGIEVVNCSRFTVLSAFPRKPLEEVLP